MLYAWMLRRTMMFEFSRQKCSATQSKPKKIWIVQLVVISTHRIFMEWDKYACNFQSMKVKKNPKNIHLGSKIDQFRQFWDIFEEEIFFLFSSLARRSLHNFCQLFFQCHFLFSIHQLLFIPFLPRKKKNEEKSWNNERKIGATYFWHKKRLNWEEI